MKKLRVGVWIQDNLLPEMGGVHGYYNKLLRALNNSSFENAEIFFLSDKKMSAKDFKIHILKNKSFKLKILNKILNITNKVSPFFKFSRKIILRAINKSRHEIYQYADVIYYLTPGCAYPDFPYIYTLWDLGHMNTYAFPEVNMDGAFEGRKKHFDLFPQKALMIFSESETGKKQCEKYLNINQERIRVIPIFSSDVTCSECKTVQPTKMIGEDFFIHYPAQYWAHKNHYNLLVAMSLIVKQIPEIKLVFTGSDKGNKSYILKTIIELRLEKNIIDLGFVSTEELRWLYKNSQGLVMPAFLGPTNMPLLESAELGCPVACTNLPGQIEQLGEYGYYFDGLNPNDIAGKIIKMVEDNKNNSQKKYNNEFNINNAMKKIDEAFLTLKHIRFCWGEKS